jgi:hypothetical protein
MFTCLPGGAVVKGAVLQQQLFHQRLWVRAQVCRNWPRPGGPWGDAQLSGLGRVWLVGKSLSHHALETPVVGRARQGCQVHGVSSDTLVRMASGLDGAVKGLKFTQFFKNNNVYILIYSSHMYSFYCILINATLTLLDLIFIYFLIPLLDTTALLELGTQVFRCTRNNIC